MRDISYVRRLLSFIATNLFVLLLTFAAFRIVPGDPATAILGTEATLAQIEALQAKLGLDQPLAVQFVRWLQGALTLDFGESLRYAQPVLTLIADRLPLTLSLALLALLLTLAVALPLGVAAARANGKIADLFISAGTQLGLAVPSFWTGILLITLFGVTLKWFAVSQYTPWTADPWLAFKSLLLPSIALAIPQMAIVVRYVRTNVLEQMHLDYVRTARSKGLKETVISFKHVLKNALIPVVTVVGINFGEILAGSLVVEQVFTLPGIGRLLLTAIGNRDYPLVQGLVVFIGFTVVTVNFAVDLLYRQLDPKLRLR